MPDYFLDPELAAVAPYFPRLDLTRLEEARENTRQLVENAPVHQAQNALIVTDLRITGSGGAPSVPIRLYAPAERTGLLPAVVLLHPGAWVLGGLAIGDHGARELADAAGVVVINVDYRLAPEHPYPAALEDAYAALYWAANDAEEYGVAADRLAVMGESSGGGLAAALTMLTRDRGGPALRAQFLDAPTVDDRLDTPSIRELPDTPTWQVVNSLPSWRYYLGSLAEPGGDDVPLYAAPARAKVEDLQGLPPAVVTAYQVDPTRDEGIEYAIKLIRAGIPTEIHHYAGAFHVAHVALGTAIAQRMVTDRAAAVRRLLFNDGS